MGWTRRNLVLGATWTLAAATATHSLARSSNVPAWSLPIRHPGAIAGDGMVIRHGFACENTWFSPGNWHTAEDWYRADDTETAGAEVLAVLAGDVTWIGSDYPGRVVIVEHDLGLFSMYGHLDYEVEVTEGQRVEAGDTLGRVLAWPDGRAPSHLHFELRDFFLNPIVNGDTPRNGFSCGYRCPPGPGYWPINDSLHPAQVGWRNPQHVLHGDLAGAALPPWVVVASTADGLRGPLRSAPEHDAAEMGNLRLRSGDRFDVLGRDVGDPSSTGTGADAYRVWYRVGLPSGATGWLPAFVPDDRDTGSDGRPSGLHPVLLPAPD